MNFTNRTLNKIHFSVLAFIFLNLFIQFVSNYGLENNLILCLIIVVYFTGTILFFINRIPFKKIAIYYFFYILSIIIGVLFWIFGGIFFALLASFFLKPIYPKEVKYKKDKLIIYSEFNGFFATCCEYEITENKLFKFQKHIGKIRLEGQLETENIDIKIINNEVEYKHPKINYLNDLKIEVDTIERIKIE
jgi:hypothetical protein